MIMLLLLYPMGAEAEANIIDFDVVRIIIYTFKPTHKNTLQRDTTTMGCFNFKPTFIVVVVVEHDACNC